MTQLLMLKGLPGSGKTTYAKQLKGYKRVNMDDLRAMLDDGKYSKHKERVMQRHREMLIHSLLSDGFNVVVDDTNLHPKHAITMREIVATVKRETGQTVTFSELFKDTPLQECIQNDLNRPRSVGSKVIMRMYNEYFEQAHPEKPEWELELPTCIIVDIDGTIAQMNGRGPYDWERVGEDLPKQEIIDLVHMYREAGIHIVLMSGRDSKARDITMDWLVKHEIIQYDIPNWDLYMRPEGDQRKDTVVKEELYNAHVKGKYNVELVLDDRDSVVDMWRRLGLTCLQVAPGDF